MAYNVLVVDDSLPMRSVIKKTIKASGFNVGLFFDASNGKEALDVSKHEWIDLVLTDYNMPDMNGIELIESIREDELLKEIPIVMITTEGSKQRIQEFMEKGATGYIKKPFAPEEIRNKLSHIMGEQKDGEEFADQGDEDLDF